MKEWLSNVRTSEEDGTVSVTVGPPPSPADQTYEMAPVESLTTHPENPRLGNIAAIRESIRANGFYGA